MKLFFTGLFLMITSSWAAPCEVGGISDSPQKLSCYLSYGRGVEKLRLSCQEGKYSLSWLNQNHEIGNSYHLDVETGSSPLVFESDDLKLTTISFNIYSRAEFVFKGEKLSGLCFHR